jgi:hypothetical protein
MPARKELIGARFGRLLVVSELPKLPDASGRMRRRFMCRCDCGVEKDVNGEHLSAGRTCSCGCFRRETVSKLRTKHGETKSGTTPEYESWAHIVQRCTNPANKDFKHYGGRGITICDEWRNDYAAFLAHVGRKPSPKHSIDRIKNDGNYEPGNVRWATQSMQVANRRFLGRRRSLS